MHLVYFREDISVLKECSEQYLSVTQTPLSQVLEGSQTSPEDPIHTCYQSLLNLRNDAQAYTHNCSHLHTMHADSQSHTVTVSVEQLQPVKSCIDKLITQVLVGVQNLLKHQQSLPQGQTVTQSQGQDDQSEDGNF